MFQISRRVDYAVRMMIELGLHEGEFMSAQRMSVRTDVPKSFLHKISIDLSKADLVHTQAGPGGGLSLGKPLDQINMLHIIEAVDGPICLNICLIRPQECKRDRFCPAHDFWGHLQASLVRQLQEATLVQLVEEARALMKNPRSKDMRDDIPYLIGRESITVTGTPALAEDKV